MNNDHNIENDENKEISQDDFDEIAIKPLKSKEIEISQNTSRLQSSLSKGKGAVAPLFYMGFSNHYERFFKKHNGINKIYVTNEKKDRGSMTKIYYLVISRDKIEYITKSEQKHKYVYFDFKDKKLCSKKQEIINPEMKNHFFNNLKIIGTQIEKKLAYVFETKRAA